MKTLGMIALLFCASTVSAHAQLAIRNKWGHGTTVGTTPGQYGTSTDDPQRHNFATSAHPNAETKDANKKEVTGTEGDRRIF